MFQVLLTVGGVYAAQLDSLSAALARFDSAPSRPTFVAARLAYKRAEWWLAFSDTAAASALNAPPAEGFEMEADDAADSAEKGVRGPAPLGFQAAEASLNPARLAGWRAVVSRLRDKPPADRSLVLEAARAELARVEAIGLANGDSRSAHAGLRESAAALAGLADAVALVEAPRLTLALRRAAEVLVAAEDTSFDRLRFIVRQGAAIARELPPPASHGFWRTASLFDSAAFDAWAFVAPDAPPPTPAEVSEGQSLFTDTRLGGRSGHACSTCHQPSRAFTDSQPLNVTRNAPTLLNAALERDLFYDLRAHSLEAQIADVMANPREMSGEPASPRVRWALAAYLRTLVRLDSRFDRALRGDTLAITAAERRGFTVFMSKGQCGTCHMLPLFNGMSPPAFDRTEVEVLGVPRTADTIHAVPDPDVGRWAITHNAQDLHAFRVASLRNIALTAPYMHNGVYRTLEQVIDFYDRGGGEGIGARLSNQTLPARRLNLSAADKRALVAFLGSLTDTSGTDATTNRTAALSRSRGPTDRR